MPPIHFWGNSSSMSNQFLAYSGIFENERKKRLKKMRNVNKTKILTPQWPSKHLKSKSQSKVETYISAKTTVMQKKTTDFSLILNN